MVDNAHGDPRMNGNMGNNNRRITGDPRMVNVPMFPRNNNGSNPNVGMNVGNNSGNMRPPMQSYPGSHTPVPNAVPFNNPNAGVNVNNGARMGGNGSTGNNVFNGKEAGGNGLNRAGAHGADNGSVNNSAVGSGINRNSIANAANNGFNGTTDNASSHGNGFIPRGRVNVGNNSNAGNNVGNAFSGNRPSSDGSHVSNNAGLNRNGNDGISREGLRESSAHGMKAGVVNGTESNGLNRHVNQGVADNGSVNSSAVHMDTMRIHGGNAGSRSDGGNTGNGFGSRGLNHGNDSVNGGNRKAGTDNGNHDSEGLRSGRTLNRSSDGIRKTGADTDDNGSNADNGARIGGDGESRNRGGSSRGKVGLKPLSRVRIGAGVDEDSAEARRLRRMVEDDDELGDGGASHGSKRGSYVDEGEHGAGTGRRGADRFRRDRRVSQGVALDEKQVRRLDDLNRRARSRKGIEADDVSKDFVLQEADVRVLDYLVKWRFSTIRDIGRVAGWSESYLKTHRRLNAYLDVGLLTADRVPLENYRYVQLTPDGVFFSGWSFMGKEDALDFLRSYRGHAFGLASLASHLLNRMRDADEVERDLLGVGEEEYAEIRHEILDGVSRVVSEREFRSSWQSIRAGAGRSPASLTDARFRHAMEKEYMDAHEVKGNPNSPLSRQTFELYCNNPEYRGSMAWLWVVYGNDVIQSAGNGRIRRVPVDNVAVDDSGRPIIVKERGDLFSTRDHCPDLVIARPRDRVTGRPRSIAVELELTAKTEEEYMRTMCAYTGACGKLLYGKVVWQVVNAALGNLIRRGAVKAGAVEGRDFVIVPVYSEDVRGSFARGVDMQPGTWKDADEPRGYTVLKTLMDEGIDAEL